MQIDKNIPMPRHEKTGKLMWFRGYDLSLLEIGDSVLIIVDKIKNNTQPIRSKVGHIQRATGRKFLTKKEGEGVRIWRYQ